MAVSPIYHAVLDIDDVLAFRTAKPEKLLDFIQQEGTVIEACRPHYVLPGVKEFIQLLFQTEDLQVSFFSAGLKIRNDLFVRALLEFSLGGETYESLKSRVSVLSQDDLTERTGIHNFGLDRGKYQKDLTKVASDAQALANTLIIDDDETYVADGQAKHFLYARSSNNRPFCDIEFRKQFYDLDGTRFLKIEFEDVYNHEAKNRARDKKCIGVLLNNQGGPPLSIGFVDRNSHEYRELPLEDPELSDAISSSYFYGKKIKDCSPEVTDKIRIFVESHGGKTRKIWRAANRIYYVAGVLFTALSLARRNRVSLSDALFHLYCKEKREGDSYKDVIRRLSKHDEMYWRGLGILQSINSNLRLTTPQSYLGV